jgi:RNA polymerase-binding transcription factor DksA
MALRRIAAGTYGSCAQCGAPIARDRLYQHPSTVYCGPECQSQVRRSAFQW